MSFPPNSRDQLQVPPRASWNAGSASHCPNSAPTIDEIAKTTMNKTKIRDALLSLEAEKLAYSEQAYKEYLAGAARDRSEPSDQDAESQEFESSEVATAFECPIHSYEAAIATIKEIDFGPKATISEGALFRFSGRWFIVAVASEAFQAEGVTIMGISTQAPLYQAIEGFRAEGMTTFNGKKIFIEAVA